MKPAGSSASTPEWQRAQSRPAGPPGPPHHCLGCLPLLAAPWPAPAHPPPAGLQTGAGQVAATRNSGVELVTPQQIAATCNRDRVVPALHASWHAAAAGAQMRKVGSSRGWLLACLVGPASARCTGCLRDLLDLWSRGSGLEKADTPPALAAASSCRADGSTSQHTYWADTVGQHVQPGAASMSAPECHHRGVTCISRQSNRDDRQSQAGAQHRGRGPHIVLRCLVQSQTPCIKHSTILLRLFCVAGRHKDRWACSKCRQTAGSGGQAGSHSHLTDAGSRSTAAKQQGHPLLHFKAPQPCYETAQDAKVSTRCAGEQRPKHFS